MGVQIPKLNDNTIIQQKTSNETIGISDLSGPILQKRKRKTGWSIVTDPNSIEKASSDVESDEKIINTKAEELSIQDLLLQQLNISDKKYTKTVEVSGFDEQVEIEKLICFISDCLIAIKGNIVQGTPLENYIYNSDINILIISFRFAQEATNCLVLDGIKFGKYRLRINRSTEYVEWLYKIDKLQSISISTITSVERGMLIGLPIFSTVSCESLGEAYNDSISRIECASGSFIRTVAGAPIGRAECGLLIDLPPEPIWTEMNTIQLLTLCGPLLFTVIVQKQCDKYINNLITEKKLPKEQYEVLTKYIDTIKPQFESSFVLFQYKAKWSLDRLSVLMKSLTLSSYRPNLIYKPHIFFANNIPYLYCLINALTAKKKKSTNDLVIPTKVIYIEAIASLEEMSNDKTYEEIHDDLYATCKKFGLILSFELIRPDNPIVSQLVDEILMNKYLNLKSNQNNKMQNITYDYQSFVGWLFVEFDSTRSACNFKTEYNNVLYGSRFAKINFLDERIFNEKNFTKDTIKPNTDRNGSSLCNPELNKGIDLKVAKIEQNRTKMLEAARLAATAAANAVLGINDSRNYLMNIKSITNIDQPDLNLDIDAEESDMEE